MRNSWNQLVKEIRDTNRVLLHRQHNARYIPIRDESSEFTLGDYCINENGHIEDMEWVCSHVNTEHDTVETPFMTFEGVKMYGTTEQYCTDCEAVYNGLNEVWEYEK
jgi:hypothetical protein